VCRADYSSVRQRCQEFFGGDDMPDACANIFPASELALITYGCLLMMFGKGENRSGGIRFV
jgi:hypothetical protein